MDVVLAVVNTVAAISAQIRNVYKTGDDLDEALLSSEKYLVKYARPDGEYIFAECASCTGPLVGHKEDDLAKTTCENTVWAEHDKQTIKNMIKTSTNFEAVFGIADYNDDIDKVRRNGEEG